MRVKSLLFVILSLLLATTLIGAASSVVTTVAAPAVVDEGLVPGSVFSIDITVNDVEDLWGFEFRLGFDPAILTAISYASYPPFVMPWPSEIGPDYVSVAYSMPFGTPPGGGLYGSEPLASIEFTVNDYGGSYLDVYDSLLTTPGGLEIYHEMVDGYFANVIPDWSANLVRRSAWPEHHHWVESKDPDCTLTGKVKNLGSMPTIAKVVFTITNDDGLWATVLETESAKIPSGHAKDLTIDVKKTDLNTIPPGPYGTYYVKAQCWYDSDGDGVIDAPGTKLKNTRFTFVA